MNPDENPVRFRALPRARHPLMDAAPDGLDDNWHWAVPAVFAALNAGGATAALPSKPEDDDPHSQSLGYWGALHYLLLYRLGWSNPGQGLRRWIDDGADLEDPALRLVRDVWQQDRTLDSYIAWTVRSPMTFLDSQLPATEPWGTHAAPVTDPEWLALTNRVIDSPSPGAHFDLSGGWDPLHLSAHPGEGAERDPGARFEVTDRVNARGLFLTDAAGAWYHDLTERSAALPKHAHDWRIDVYVRPLGYLGAFRRSRVTGLMFSGRHRTHQYGN